MRRFAGVTRGAAQLFRVGVIPRLVPSAARESFSSGGISLSSARAEAIPSLSAPRPPGRPQIPTRDPRLREGRDAIHRLERQGEIRPVLYVSVQPERAFDRPFPPEPLARVTPIELQHTVKVITQRARVDTESGRGVAEVELSRKGEGLGDGVEPRPSGCSD